MRDFRRRAARLLAASHPVIEPGPYRYCDTLCRLTAEQRAEWMAFLQAPATAPGRVSRLMLEAIGLKACELPDYVSVAESQPHEVIT